MAHLERQVDVLAEASFDALSSNARAQIKLHILYTPGCALGAMEEQYAPDRITRSNVQTLIKKVSVHSDASYSTRFLQEMPARVAIALSNGAPQHEVTDCEGSCSLPTNWGAVYREFETLAAPSTTLSQRDAIANVVSDLENHTVAELMRPRQNPPSARSDSKKFISMGRR